MDPDPAPNPVRDPDPDLAYNKYLILKHFIPSTTEQIKYIANIKTNFKLFISNIFTISQ